MKERRRGPFSMCRSIIEEIDTHQEQGLLPRHKL
ncbi:hypothetical protein Esi_0021_0161 [Ectocarpus siliculosus]|uniref:Uncharacterized protein n=1 Tax=Ectocarpus siliculosus TaxID=2880 RepID=D7FR11_ECTSI|nr:hypothetical protein Esi_0021_0161 [Ectocarpus siliculosus]|eukprot:CBJ26165.1 hypothetical protein Esi_0021_0161 [Ectocarpus siliculosus]